MTQTEIDRGYGWWFLAVGAGYGMYALDRYWKFFYLGQSFFPVYEGRLISSDYFILAFFFVFLSFVPLSHALEKYGLGKKVSWLSVLSMVMAGVLMVFRPIENALIDTENPPGIASMILSAIVFLAIAVVVIRLLTLYISMIRDLPNGTALRKKAIGSFVGVFLWIVWLAGGANTLESLDAKIFDIIAPASYFVILGLLWWSFRRN